MTPQSTTPPAETERDASGPEQMATMQACPMAEPCKRMSEKPMPKFLLLLPGLLMIAAGVLIFVIPTLLVWLVALASISMGVMSLIFAISIIKMGNLFRRIQS